MTSKSQIDRLGERLKEGNVSDVDLRLLDEYRRSFVTASDLVVERIQHQFGLQPTARPQKTPASIIQKLRRLSTRLTRIQDIAGCRLTVRNIVDQDRTVADLVGLFPGAAVVDRRERPSHGYRAVHVIVTVEGKSVEIQVRTDLQHLWAELSERLSDALDPAIKYGGGEEPIRRLLGAASESVAASEALEKRSDLRELADSSKARVAMILEDVIRRFRKA